MAFRDLTPQHIKAARALLEWNQMDLAEACGLGPTTIKRYESKGLAKASLQNIEAISEALEAAGIEFSNGGSPGVRLHRRTASGGGDDA